MYQKMHDNICDLYIVYSLGQSNKGGTRLAFLFFRDDMITLIGAQFSCMAYLCYNFDADRTHKCLLIIDMTVPYY